MRYILGFLVVAIILYLLSIRQGFTNIIPADLIGAVRYMKNDGRPTFLPWKKYILWNDSTDYYYQADDVDNTGLNRYKHGIYYEHPVRSINPCMNDWRLIQN